MVRKIDSLHGLPAVTVWTASVAYQQQHDTDDARTQQAYQKDAGIQGIKILTGNVEQFDTIHAGQQGNRKAAYTMQRQQTQAHMIVPAQPE
jgi:hypothetical protein